jgi:hypothetical protein
MVWTVPTTAVIGSVFPSAVYNQTIRDNLLQTMPAKTTALGSFFATIGTNQIAERLAQSDYIGGMSNTSSTTYTDLASGVGPVVSCQTGTVAAVFLFNNSYTTGTGSWMSFDISGATTQAASDNFALQLQLSAGQHCGACFLIDNLTPGLNTFTAKFRTSSLISQFSSRRLAVWPF